MIVGYLALRMQTRILKMKTPASSDHAHFYDASRRGSFHAHCNAGRAPGNSGENCSLLRVIRVSLLIRRSGWFQHQQIKSVCAAHFSPVMSVPT